MSTKRLFTLGKSGFGPIQETPVEAHQQVQKSPPKLPPYKIKESDSP